MSLFYPFNHECQWRGPFYIWSSNQVEMEPPKDCKPVYACCICSAQRPVDEPSDILLPTSEKESRNVE